MKYDTNRTELLERTEHAGEPELPVLTPRADIEETADGYLLSAAIPGVSREDVQLQVHGEMLELSARVNTGGSTAANAPRIYKRKFKLGRDIDPERVSARLTEGLLTVTLEKAAKALPRRIEIQ